MDTGGAGGALGSGPGAAARATKPHLCPARQERTSPYLLFSQAPPAVLALGSLRKDKKEEEELKSMIIIANLLTVNAICSLTGKIFRIQVWPRASSPREPRETCPDAAQDAAPGVGQPQRGASSSCLWLLQAFCQVLGTCECSPWLGSAGCPAAPGRAQPPHAPKDAPVRAPRSARPAPGVPAGRSSGTTVPAPGTSWRPAPSFKENFLKAALQLIGFCNIANPNVHKSCQTLKNNESSLYITGFYFFFFKSK